LVKAINSREKDHETEKNWGFRTDPVCPVNNPIHKSKDYIQLKKHILQLQEDAKRKALLN